LRETVLRVTFFFDFFFAAFFDFFFAAFFPSLAGTSAASKTSS
jgi:hypothetical protein